MHNRYTIDLPDKSILTLQIGIHNPSLDKLLSDNHCNTFAYLTAFNPRSTTFNKDENQLRQEKLVKDIESLGFSYLTGLSFPESGEWEPEVCAFVYNLPRTTTWDLCIKYQQDAAVVGDRGGSPKLFFTNETLREDFLNLLHNCVLD